MPAKKGAERGRVAKGTERCVGIGWLVGGWSEEMETQQPASLCLIFVLR